MTRRIDITPVAESDLDAKFDYLAEGSIQILRVIHAARDIERIFNPSGEA